MQDIKQWDEKKSSSCMYEENSKQMISLIIVSYNYGKFLVQAVESVLEQTILPDEILIVDDCSTDNTQDIGTDYANKYPDLIKFHRNPENMGIVANFNNAVKMSRGDFICFLGADNLFRPNYIEKTSQILLQNPDVAIAYTDFVLFGDRAKIVYDGFLEERKGEIIDEKYYTINFPEFDKDKLKKGNYIHGSSMYRRDAFEQVGGYQDKNNAPEDYNLFYRMVSHGWKAKRVPLPLLEYRQHSVEQANIKNIALAELDFYKKQNSELKKVVAHRDRDIEELKGVITHRDRDIEELKGVVTHRDRDIEELKGVITHREDDIKELKGVITHRDRDIEELKEVITLRKNDIEELKEVIAHRDRDIEFLNEEIKKNRKAIEGLEQNNNELLDNKERFEHTLYYKLLSKLKNKN